MSSKIVAYDVGWLVGARDCKILEFKQKFGIIKKKSRINQEMVNTKVLPDHLNFVQKKLLKKNK